MSSPRVTSWLPPTEAFEFALNSDVIVNIGHYAASVIADHAQELLCSFLFRVFQHLIRGSVFDDDTLVHEHHSIGNLGGISDVENNEIGNDTAQRIEIEVGTHRAIVEKHGFHCVLGYPAAKQ